MKTIAPWLQKEIKLHHDVETTWNDVIAFGLEVRYSKFDRDHAKEIIDLLLQGKADPEFHEPWHRLHKLPKQSLLKLERTIVTEVHMLLDTIERLRYTRGKQALHLWQHLLWDLLTRRDNLECLRIMLKEVDGFDCGVFDLFQALDEDGAALVKSVKEFKESERLEALKRLDPMAWWACSG